MHVPRERVSVHTNTEPTENFIDRRLRCQLMNLILEEVIDLSSIQPITGIPIASGVVRSHGHTDAARLAVAGH